MTAGWLVYALLIGALVAIAAAALDGAARARRWPTRWIWAASMLVTLAIIAGSARPAAGGATVSVVDAVAVRVPPSAGQAGTPISVLLHRLREGADLALSAGVGMVVRRLPAWAGEAAALLWLACAGAAFVMLALVHLRVRRERRAWPAAELHGHRVRVAPAVGPAVVGMVRPEIVVPRWLLSRDATEQRLVLAHEEEHLRAADHLLLSGACAIVALMPWHPAAWWLLARLRLAIELDCDARVLRRGVPARSYGEMLIDLAGQCSGFQVGATALADRTSHLERRLLAMRPTTKPFALIRAGALCAAAALSLAAACEARVPTAAEIQNMDAASAERTAQKAGLLEALHGATPEFYVNGAKVTPAEAHAIPAKDIATVNVEKAQGPSGVAVIRIATVATGADGAKYRTAGPGSGATESAGAALKGLHEKMSLSSHTFDGLVLIDGVRADAATLHQLDPRNIVTVEVIKGVAATELSSDPAAKNGIIKVVTKK